MTASTTTTRRPFELRAALRRAARLISMLAARPAREETPCCFICRPGRGIVAAPATMEEAWRILCRLPDAILTDLDGRELAR